MNSPAGALFRRDPLMPFRSCFGSLTSPTSAAARADAPEVCAFDAAAAFCAALATSGVFNLPWPYNFAHAPWRGPTLVVWALAAGVGAWLSRRGQATFAWRFTLGVTSVTLVVWLAADFSRGLELLGYGAVVLVIAGVAAAASRRTGRRFVLGVLLLIAAAALLAGAVLFSRFLTAI